MKSTELASPEHMGGWWRVLSVEKDIATATDWILHNDAIYIPFKALAFQTWESGLSWGFVREREQEGEVGSGV